eukprot:1159482-Pelagomonas_calceolata.AAC.5
MARPEQGEAWIRRAGIPPEVENQAPRFRTHALRDTQTDTQPHLTTLRQADDPFGVVVQHGYCLHRARAGKDSPHACVSRYAVGSMLKCSELKKQNRMFTGSTAKSA